VKRKRFSVEEIVAVLKQAELGMPVADIIRQVGISEQTYYRWKKAYSGLQSDQVREFKQLQDENARLKKLVAELSLDKAVSQDVLSRNSPAGQSAAILPRFNLRSSERHVRKSYNPIERFFNRFKQSDVWPRATTRLFSPFRPPFTLLAVSSGWID
jgi:putative transposase